MDKKLYLMCGCSGSGKSTYAKKLIAENEEGTVAWISRDLIRFSLIGENDSYFTNENEAFKLYIDGINNGIADDKIKIVIADATHLNKDSRDKVLNKIKGLDNVDIIAVDFKLSISTCLKRNELRTGLERVPESAIRKMYFMYQSPTMDEKYKYNSIIKIRE